MIKSPLRNKLVSNKSIETIIDKIPEGSVVDTFLLFSGELEVSLSQYNRFVCAHTNKYAIYEFWQTLLDEPKRVNNVLTSERFKFEEKMYTMLQENWVSYKDPVIRSAIFFMLNQMSETGSISHGKLINKAFNPIALADLRSFRDTQNLHFIFDKTDDFLKPLDGNLLGEYILIPAGKFSYNLFEEGKNVSYDTVSINHKKLRDKFLKSDKKTILTYNYSARAKSFYKKSNILMIDKYGRVTENDKAAVELIIANF